MSVSFARPRVHGGSPVEPARPGRHPVDVGAAEHLAGEFDAMADLLAGSMVHRRCWTSHPRSTATACTSSRNGCSRSTSAPWTARHATRSAQRPPLHSAAIEPDRQLRADHSQIGPRHLRPDRPTADGRPHLHSRNTRACCTGQPLSLGSRGLRRENESTPARSTSTTHGASSPTTCRPMWSSHR
jgi:hypothetical protein